jgi:hypothetical protein
VLGASLNELAFVGLLVALVLLAPVAPRLGEAIGALGRDGGLTRPSGALPPPKPPESAGTASEGDGKRS